jgi:Flp pilus assembly protein TadG
MFATAELGRALYQYSTLTKAVEAGARYYASAAQDPFTDPVNAQSRTRNLVVFASPANSGETVLPGFGTGDVTVGGLIDDHISVSADYDFDPIIGKLPIIRKVLGFNLTMTATQTMRAL